MVDAFITSLNVAIIALPTATPVALFARFVELTVGAVVSRVMLSLAAPDIFPAASLYHTYTVFVPLLPLRVNGTSFPV
jgi:hypothetical protein